VDSHVSEARHGATEVIGLPLIRVRLRMEGAPGGVLL